jgi:hypothetical protein
MTTKAKTSTDNTLKTIGFHFQYLIALECCLNSKRGDFIYIEQYGDVSDRNSIIEVKHHIYEHQKLSDRHEDFWKTLKNCVENYKTLDDFSNVILLTTAVVDDNSAFYLWNTLKKEDKLAVLSKITSAKITETIKPFVTKIFDFRGDFKEQNLLEILGKFQIKHSHLGLKQKIEMLAQHDKLATIPQRNKIPFLLALLGKIVVWGVSKTDYNWEISMNNFMNYLEHDSSHYVGKAIPLPKLPLETINYESYSHSPFVQEINKIGLDNRFVNKAIDDFHQAGRTQIFYIEQDIEYSSIIQEYENELEEEIWYRKEGFLNNMNDETDILSHSKGFYIECMQLSPKQVRDIANNNSEFQRGTIHRVADNGKICWHLEETVLV